MPRALTKPSFGANIELIFKCVDGEPEAFFLPREGGMILKARLLKLVEYHPRSVCKHSLRTHRCRRVKAEL